MERRRRFVWLLVLAQRRRRFCVIVFSCLYLLGSGAAAVVGCLFLPLLRNLHLAPLAQRRRRFLLVACSSAQSAALCC